MLVGMEHVSADGGKSEFEDGALALSQNHSVVMKRRRHLEGIGAGLRWVNDHHPVEAPGDVLGEGRRVTVVGMHACRSGINLVCGGSTWRDRFPTVLLAEMGTVKVKIVGMAGPIREVDSHRVSLSCPNDGGRDSAVVGPSFEMGVGGYLVGAIPAPLYRKTLFTR